MALMRTYEAKTVKQAVTAAAKALDIDPEDLKYDIVSYGSTGTFGLVGVKKAQIAVQVPAANDSKPQTDAPVEPAPDTDVEPAPDTEEEEAAPTEDPADVGRQVVQRLIDGIASGASVTVSKQNGRYCFDVAGGNPAVLIGRHGQTLEAIQYLVEKIVNKRCQQRVRVHVDVENYLANRRDNLIRLSKKLAEKAKRNGKPVTIGQMNPHDRRIVHLALKEFNGVRTQSLGNGFIRKLTIFPKKIGRRTQRHSTRRHQAQKR